MPSPLEQAGAVREPSEYATLSMDRAITGLWTQRSPLRDADVPYLYGKFYSASRFDSLIDGLNREMTARLTAARPPGSSVYNSNNFPGAYSMYAFKRIINGVEVVRVIYDSALNSDPTIYDATAGQKSVITTKSLVLGVAGKARFLGIDTTLYITDGGSKNLKWMQPGGWQKQTSLDTTEYQVGTSVLDTHGKLQYLKSSQVGTVSNIEVSGNAVIFTVSGTDFNMVPGMTFRPMGLTTFILNDQLLIVTSIIPSGSDLIVTSAFTNPPIASTGDAGTLFTEDVGTFTTTAAITPAWNVTPGGATTDGLSIWQNFSDPVYDWGPPPAPAIPPVVTIQPLAGASTGFWQPFATYALNIVILAANGLINGTPGGRSGGTLPPFLDSAYPSSGSPISDGALTWTQANWLGGGATAVPWRKSISVTTFSGVSGDVLVDNNGNLQMATAGSGSTGAGSEPTWNTAYGGTTADSSITWTNYGPYLGLSFQGRKYGYAFHCIDGSVSTLSPLSNSTNGLINGTLIQGFGSDNSQVDSIWVFHTPDGEPTPLLIGVVDNPGAGSLWSFIDFFIDSLLVAEIAGPQSGRNNPPPVGMTAPAYHLQRVWAIYKNTVIHSGGPDVLVGNGNTSFRAIDFEPFTEQPIKLIPITTQNGGLLVICTSNTYVILGTGTPANPFYVAMYMAGVGILSYDAVDIVGSTLYLMTAKKKCVSLDPGGGYTEFGFPIGDQFSSVTTGAALGGVVDANVVTPALAQRSSAGIVTLFFLGASMPLWVGAANFANVQCNDRELNAIGVALLSHGSGTVIGGKTYYFVTYQSQKNHAIAQEPVTGTMQQYDGPELGALYDPASSFVTWAELGSGDTAVYVSDGAVGWFRFSPVASPESGYIWSPRRAIVGGTSAVQAIETSPGVTQLLIAPAVITPAPGGPILFRDSSVNADWIDGGYSTFPSWEIKGNIVLCQSGEVAEIAHIGLKSVAQGEKPRVGLLLGEISATDQTPFDWLDITSNDPPDLPPSETLYSDRYTALQNGVCPKCDNFQLAIDYGEQDEPDEMLTFSIYGATHAERRQQ